MSEIVKYLLLTGAGLAAGFVNTPAGGGSMITIGVMMLLGIDPVMASATNRVGVLMSTASAVTAFKQDKSLDFKESFSLAVWTLPGAFAGALFSTRISSVLFQRILMITMVLVLLSIILPKKRMVSETAISEKKYLLYPVMFLIGLYGGFIQIGVGYLMMSSLFHIVHMDLVKVTKHKMFIVFLYTIPVIVLYIFTGRILWIYAVFLSIGNWAGAWLAAKLAIKKGNVAVKSFLALAVLLMTGQLVISFFG